MKQELQNVQPHELKPHDIYALKGRRSSGSCGPFSISLRRAGRWMARPVGVTSSAGPASSNSKVRTRVNTSAFILWASTSGYR